MQCREPASPGTTFTAVEARGVEPLRSRPAVRSWPTCTSLRGGRAGTLPPHPTYPSPVTSRSLTEGSTAAMTRRQERTSTWLAASLDGCHPVPSCFGGTQVSTSDDVRRTRLMEVLGRPRRRSQGLLVANVPGLRPSGGERSRTSHGTDSGRGSPV